MREAKFAPQSVLLTDWAVNDLSMAGTASTTLYELMLLALLYDNVLIQDEVFALSNKCARWFGGTDGIGLLQRCLDVEGLTVLTHPLLAYPTDELKELAQAAPILARARYIEHYGSKGDKLFKPNRAQLRLYHGLDACLLGRPNAHRPAGALRQFDIMPTFAHLLREVLASRRFRKWRKSAFDGISDRMAEDFVALIDRPEDVPAQLKMRNKQFNVVRDHEGQPTFNRSLSFLATTLYDSKQAKAMQRLIQTTFAAPFCWREDAAGRYSKSLRELLWTPTDLLTSNLGELKEGDVVSVEAHVDTRLQLPMLDEDFVKAINHVRNTVAGKQLRASIRNMYLDVDFKTQIQVWQEVAGELARAVRSTKPITVRTALCRIGSDFVVGSVAGGLYSAVTGEQTGMPSVLGSAFLGGGLGVAGHHVLAALRNDVARQQLRYSLERAVKFRVSAIEIPGIATALVSRG